MAITVTGEVARVTYENEGTGFRVLRLREVRGDLARPEGLTVVGVLPPVGPGARLRVTGELVTDARFGEQLKAESAVPLDPETLPGIERYLASGVLPGVGEGLARRIVARFGAETLLVLDQEPGRLAEVASLPRKRLPEIVAAWASARAQAGVMVLLGTHGISPAVAHRVVKHFGPRAAEVVGSQPYRLAAEVAGIGFRTADRIARASGVAGDHPDRCQAGVLHVLRELSDEGHVRVERGALEARVAELLGVREAHVGAAVEALWASGRVVVGDDGVALARLDRAERRVAEGMARLLESPGLAVPGLAPAVERFERERGVRLAPAQREALEAAVARKVVVVTGGPGTGKTTLVRALASVFDAARLGLRLAAPTGRAAKRLAEATGREASTLHRLLEVDPRTGRFLRNAEAPLELDVLVVDEVSMVDVELMAALLEALPTAARLVLVGDQDQLPSVGPGAVLRDLIASGAVPVTRLAVIFRQARESRIVLAAHAVLAGEVPVGGTRDEPRADFFLIQRRDPGQTAALVEELVQRRLPATFGLDPRREVQVLVPMHKGELGTRAMNERLQRLLVPPGASLSWAGVRYHVGDRVLQLRNDYEREVFNGDLGRVVEVNPEARRLVIALDDDRRLVAEGEQLDDLGLAWAMTVHKSQGSEYPAVVIPLSLQHFVMLGRNLLYTAVTRARRVCVLVAHPHALRLALADGNREERSTGLESLLRGAVAASAARRAPGSSLGA